MADFNYDLLPQGDKDKIAKVIDPSIPLKDKTGMLEQVVIAGCMQKALDIPFIAAFTTDPFPYGGIYQYTNFTGLKDRLKLIEGGNKKIAGKPEDYDIMTKAQTAEETYAVKELTTINYWFRQDFSKVFELSIYPDQLFRTARSAQDVVSFIDQYMARGIANDVGLWQYAAGAYAYQKSVKSLKNEGHAECVWTNATPALGLLPDITEENKNHTRQLIQAINFYCEKVKHPQDQFNMKGVDITDGLTDLYLVVPLNVLNFISVTLSDIWHNQLASLPNVKVIPVDIGILPEGTEAHLMDRRAFEIKYVGTPTPDITSEFFPKTRMTKYYPLVQKTHLFHDDTTNIRFDGKPAEPSTKKKQAEPKEFMGIPTKDLKSLNIPGAVVQEGLE